MAYKNTFGSILEEGRIRAGLSVREVARALHIRPDLVEKIERGDLAELPARGYTRNMIISYANLLGLESETVLDLYLQEANTYAISSARGSGGLYSRSSSRGPSSDHRSFSERDAEYPSMRSTDEEVRYRDARRGESGYSRTRYDREGTDGRREEYLRNGERGAYAEQTRDRRRFDDAAPAFSERPRSSYSGQRRDRYDMGRPTRSNGSGNGSSRRYDVEGDIDAPARTARHTANRPRSSRHTAVPNSHMTNLYSGPSSNSIPRGRLRGKIPYLIILAIIILLVAVIGFLVISGKTKQTEETPSAPITGLTDPESGGENGTEAIVAPVAPTSVDFTFKVEDGVDSYIEVYLDDSETPVYAQVASGPETKSYDVTGKLYFTCANKTGVTITLNGEAVEMVPDENATWLSTYTVDFSEYLAKWQEDHAEEIAAAEKAKQELIAKQEAEKSSSESSSGSASAATSPRASSGSSSSGKTTVNN